MKTTILTLIIIFASCIGVTHGQTIFKKYGFNKKPLTLSKGKYNEFFTNDEVVQIGTVRFNTRTNKVIQLLEEDSTKTNYLSDRSSMWYSVDPLAEKYPNYSPYVYCYDSPVVYKDPYGKQGEWFFEMGPILERQSIQYGLYKDDGSFPSMQNAVKYSDRPEKAAQIAAYTEAGLWGLFEVGGAVVELLSPLIIESRIARMTGGLFRSTAVYRVINNFEKFTASALKISKNGLSEIGRALQKHVGREGVFKGIKFSGKTATQEGMNVMKKILNSEKQLIDEEVNGTKTIYDKVTGRGVNVNRQGEFGGFRELPERNAENVKKVLKDDK
jgi:hypothetical protein